MGVLMVRAASGAEERAVKGEEPEVTLVRRRVGGDRGFDDLCKIGSLANV